MRKLGLAAAGAPRPGLHARSETSAPRGSTRSAVGVAPERWSNTSKYRTVRFHSRCGVTRNRWSGRRGPDRTTESRDPSQRWFVARRCDAYDPTTGPHLNTRAVLSRRELRRLVLRRCEP